MIDCVGSPVDQAYVIPAGAVKVTEPPAQKVVAPEAVITAVGNALTTNAWLTLEVQPAAFV